jgi:hypothetical protein
MSRPNEADYTSHVAYARALEAYCDGLETRELLELAAKAAGILFRGYDDFYEDYTALDKDLDVVHTWNPINSDGDALRLAVKLGLKMYIFLPDDDIGQPYTEIGRDTAEFHSDDPYAATRLAIVRAAAEIGRAMS